jgi:hypothetical protein
MKDVPLRETALGKLLILLLLTWVRAQVNLFSHCLLYRESSGFVTIMATGRQWYRDNNEYVNLVYFIVTMARRGAYTRLLRDI